MTYEQLTQIVEEEQIELIEITFPPGLKGLCKGSKIGVNVKMSSTEKKCVLAEELGHYYTTVGNIIDLKNISNRKQELRARKYAFERLIPLKKIIEASKIGCTNLFELADYLDVTEEFLKDALQHYENKYGLFVEINHYCIYFNPLTVCKYNYLEV